MRNFWPLIGGLVSWYNMYVLIYGNTDISIPVSLETLSLVSHGRPIYAVLLSFYENIPLGRINVIAYSNLSSRNSPSFWPLTPSLSLVSNTQFSLNLLLLFAIVTNSLTYSTT